MTTESGPEMGVGRQRATATMQESPSSAPSSEGLAKGSISFAEALFVSIATMAPGAGAAYAIMSGAPIAGGSLPLSVLLALVGCVLVAVAIGQLAKHMTSAAGLASYVGTAFHSTVGFVTAWAYPFVYVCAVPYLCLVFGNLLAGALVPSGTGTAFTVAWVLGTAFCLLGAFLMNFFGAKIGTLIGLILGGFEILVFIVLAIAMIITAGDRNTVSVLTEQHATTPGLVGMSGVIAGSVYAFLAFIGFEAAAPLAAETKNPKRSVPRAIIGAALIVGLFYLLTTYAVDVFFGPSKFGDFLAYNNGNGWIAIAQQLWGLGWILLVMTMLFSCLACANGGGMAATRSVWAMAHNGVLPRILAHTHPRWRSPVAAAYLIFGVATTITFIAAAIWGPVTAYLVFGEILTVAVLPIYIVAALACPFYYFRYRRQEMNVFVHVVIPILAVLVLVPPFFAGAGITVFEFIAPLSWPLNLAGPIVAAWYAIGVAIAIYLHRNRRSSLEALSFESADR